MQVDRSRQSPNFDQRPIAVEFVVIHYTVLLWKEALKVLTDTTRKVSSHLVISQAGEISELVPCM